MKSIPPFALPNFHGMASEDPNTFLFEFDVICQNYDYSLDAQNLKYFMSPGSISSPIHGAWRKHHPNLG
jgi:hypothetical protein